MPRDVPYPIPHMRRKAHMHKQPLPISSCKQCINVGVDSCTLNGQRILDQRTIPVWCPLPDPSSRIIANMESTIMVLRQGDTMSFTMGFLSLVATKLKLHIRSDALGIDIPLSDGSKVHLPFDRVTVDTAHGWSIGFSDNDVKYSLRLGEPPSLHKMVKVPGVDNEFWQECDLSH